ncbi:porin [Psychromonas sp. Urea-02u-13]|uniref:porin n=1 Tax=Psychromonas sp. Urea-02u-13 TaxID=2058326 RepID=UPI000C333EE5|nr:porin [Psychromonas sp. Urea-02u-13]PKG37544.1 porin [Psychromonas sp. Urea-02u-13]
MNQKTRIAIALSTVFIMPTGYAYEVYADEENSFSIGGHLSAGLAGDSGDDGDAQVNAPSPRINFEGKRGLTQDLSFDAKIEWGVNYLNNDKTTDKNPDVLSSRLGYVGATHTTIGRVVVGRQWAPYYSVMGIADSPVAFANDFLYNDHGNLGTGRANKMVSYGKGFNLSESMALKFGAGWQGTQGVYDSRLQASLQLQFEQFNVGYAFSNGDVADETAMSNGFSAGYGNYGKGLYVAGVYALNESITIAGSDNTAAEFIAAYALDNGLNLIANYEMVDDDDNVAGYSEAAFQVEYRVLPKVLTYAGYQVGLDSDDNKEEDKWMFGARFYL